MNFPRVSVILVSLCIASCSTSPDSGSGDSTATTSWTAALTADSADSAGILETTYASSSEIAVSWTAPEEAVDHYIVTATDAVQNVAREFSVVGSATAETLTALKSDTEYQIAIQACLDEDCTESITGDAAASASTEAEYWQIQGTGNSYATASELVSEGNTKAYAFRYGEGAGTELENMVRLYYDPFTAGEKGIKPAELSASSVTEASSVTSFTSVSDTGFIDLEDADATTYIGEMGTFQALPLSESLGGNIRMFIEAEGQDHETRIYQIDSVDGYVGLDFHSGTATQCSLASDYEDGGPCAVQTVIGIATDDAAAYAHIAATRQFKIGAALLDDWRWNGEAGTFMLVTVDLEDTTCSDIFFNLVYAVWDGSNWIVQYDEVTGCPKLFKKTQAPMPVHRGSTSYKMYYSYNPSPATQNSLSYKPMRVIYAEGDVSGEEDIVDFEDWESVDEDARVVHFLWPDGTELDDDEKSYLDDFVYYTPTGNMNFQVVYANMSGSGIGSAILLNP